jgi:hypothetical protein
MGYPRNNLLGDVLLDIFPRLSIFGNFDGQQRVQVSGRNVGHHTVIRDVIIVVDNCCSGRCNISFHGVGIAG